MEEILYLEVPTPDTGAVRTWLQQSFNPGCGEKIVTRDGFLLRFPTPTSKPTTIPEISTAAELSAFVWSVQRTTYLKVFRTGVPVPKQSQILQRLKAQIRHQFPHQYPEPPAIDLSQQSIFAALAPYYPQTVRYFEKMPNGEYDLTRVYWWEQRWRNSVRNPQQPKQVIFKAGDSGTPGAGDSGRFYY